MNDVLSGDKPLQVEFSFDIKSLVVLGLIIFAAVALARYTTK